MVAPKVLGILKICLLSPDSGFYSQSQERPTVPSQNGGHLESFCNLLASFLFRDSATATLQCLCPPFSERFDRPIKPGVGCQPFVQLRWCPIGSFLRRRTPSKSAKEHQCPLFFFPCYLLAHRAWHSFLHLPGQGLANPWQPKKQKQVRKPSTSKGPGATRAREGGS